jgi:hypothetical protein
VLDILKLQPLLFPAEFTSHRMRILVNGRDVVAEAYPPNGFHGMPVAGFMPSWLLGPRGLTGSAEAREVALGGSDTTEDQLSVRIRQAGPEVLWDCWRRTNIETDLKEGPHTGLETFRFDAQAYASELARATAQADKQWPARSVAENLRAVLWREGYSQDGGVWIRSYMAIRAPEDRPDVVEVSYQARDQSGQRSLIPGKYTITFPVHETDPDAQARDIVHRLGHEDLKPLSVHQPRQRRHR